MNKEFITRERDDYQRVLALYQEAFKIIEDIIKLATEEAAEDGLKLIKKLVEEVSEDNAREKEKA